MAKSRKYKYYVVSPFDRKYDLRQDAERAYVFCGRTTATLYGVTPNKEYVELKSKY